MGIVKLARREDKKEATRYYSSLQEKAVSKKFDGQRTLNSGATKFQKSDILLDKIALECKTKMTDSESIGIKKSWLEKTEQESLFMGKPYSALAFNFGPGQENYYIINEELFEYLVEYLNTK